MTPEHSKLIDKYEALAAENDKLHAVIERWKQMHTAASEGLRLAQLQLSEVTAHRDRLRDMLNEIRGRAYQDALSGEQSKFFSALVLKIVEDGYTEKRNEPLQMNRDPKWIEKMAKIEADAGGNVSAGCTEKRNCECVWLDGGIVGEYRDPKVPCPVHDKKKVN